MVCGACRNSMPETAGKRFISHAHFLMPFPGFSFMYMTESKRNPYQDGKTGFGAGGSQS